MKELDKELNWCDFSMTLRPKHIKDILGMSEKKMYEFLAKPPFHVARAGREIYISKLVFRNWFEGTKIDVFNNNESKGA
ncbi:DNA-binding protein [Paenibacillus chitinolyticus]|uniref:DNA-binding protein n=1 Tax=Paenibacillus chitinolyticus TaxID=79263 RepID=UPI0036DEE3BE